MFNSRVTLLKFFIILHEGPTLSFCTGRDPRMWLVPASVHWVPQTPLRHAAPSGGSPTIQQPNRPGQRRPFLALPSSVQPPSLPGTAPPPPGVLTTEACAVSSRTHTGPWTQVLEGPQSQGGLPALHCWQHCCQATSWGSWTWGQSCRHLAPPAQCPRGPPRPTATVVTESEASVCTAPVPTGQSSSPILEGLALVEQSSQMAICLF